ncbi:M1 family metallopeptidase [Gloeocapsa sp. PCC 73106]|uniref:M1 family metallopeptidase n=1 Tax=Gloeocapsa sp. PCC 73106 TaxID=102232 RepID=UPI0002AD0BA7|nr:M1 family metallopeptidase [Gloeocapsa sp. PCC 73106]ELR99655.1 aminopeptidase N [Gloeocapsa sp. PCC 73106]
MSHIHFDAEEKQRKSFELPGAKPHYNPDRPGQVEHIFLDISLNIPQATLEGTCYITLKPLRQGVKQLTLDAVELKINSVLIDSISQTFDHDGQKLNVYLQQPTTSTEIKLAIAYSVTQPQRGIYFIQPDSDYPHKTTQVWTQGEDEDSRYWFPCFDYPGQLATSEIRVRIAKPYLAISNGELIATETSEHETIYHWLQRQVHPTYLMTLAVGDFAVIEDQWQDIPVNYYVAKGREADAQRSMGKTPQMIEFFSQKFGYPYPYPKYYQVCVDDFIFGGMENTSTTLLTDRCLLDAKAATDNTRTESLVAHELAHQWFGDLVVIKHWSHAWLKEGMASYAEVLWTEVEYGKDAAAYYLLGEARSYIQEDASRYRRPIVTNVYREAIELYDRHLYEKGACVYHMIRTLLGDELFDRSIATFVQNYAHQTVETVDLIRAIEKTTGYNVSPLFDQYVFRGGHPDFKISYSWDGQGQLAGLTVTQTQAKDNPKDLFNLSIPVAFGYLGDQIELKTITLNLEQPQQSFYFPLEKKPDFVSFDVGNNYLKTVSLEYPLPELKAQLKYDPDPISRIYAAIAIAKKGGLEAISALGESLTNDTFWGVRKEVAKQLAKIKLDQSVTTLITGLQDTHPQVRGAVIESLSKYKTPLSYATLKQCLSEGDTSYYNEAAAIKALGSMIGGNLQDQEAEVIELLQGVLNTKSGWNEVVRSGAIAGLSQLKTSAVAADTIIQYTAKGVPQPLRLAAIRGIGSVASGQKPEQIEKILQILEDLASESFYLTQVAVISALGQMKDPGAIAILDNLIAQSSDGRVKRIASEAKTKVQQKMGSDQAIKELRHEIEQLKQENQDLKSRLAKLEVK